MTPSAFHVPPRAVVASARLCTGPPVISTLFSFAFEKNPTDLLSGDQNGRTASSVPLRGCGVAESKGCRKSCLVPLLSDTYTTYFPLGEICGFNIPCFETSGESKVPRMTGFGSITFRQWENPTHTRARTKKVATPHANCSLDCRL